MHKSNAVKVHPEDTMKGDAMSDQIKECPKCHYIRQPEDTAPADECPKCGVIYTKAMVRQGKNGPAIPATWKPQESADPGAATTRPNDNPVEQVTTVVNNLVDCMVCGKPHSYQAQICPTCGHPNPDAPRTAGLIAGVIAITLGIDAALMPYFAAVFLVPATFAAAAVTAILRMRTLAVIALIPAFIGLYGIYTVSKEIRANQAAAEKASARMQSDMAREQARIQREIDQILRNR